MKALVSLCERRRRDRGKRERASKEGKTKSEKRNAHRERKKNVRSMTTTTPTELFALRRNIQDFREVALAPFREAAGASVALLRPSSAADVSSSSIAMSRRGHQHHR